MPAAKTATMYQVERTVRSFCHSIWTTARKPLLLRARPAAGWLSVVVFITGCPNNR